jgi:hypothetical protein
VDEIPMDVCRLCIDAWKISAEIQSLTGAQVAPKPITVQTPVQLATQIVEPSMPEAEPKPPILELPGLGSSEIDQESHRQLSELDSRFMNDKIDADEYVRQRRAIVSQLSNVKKVDTPSFGFTTIDLEEDAGMDGEPGKDAYRRILPLILIERKRTGYSLNSYPSNFKLPKALDEKKIRSMYNLYESLGEDRILVQFEGTRIGLLGKKDNRMLCMVLDAKDRLEDHEEEIRHLNDLFQDTDSLDDLVKALSKAMKSTKTFSQLST